MSNTNRIINTMPTTDLNGWDMCPYDDYETEIYTVRFNAGSQHRFWLFCLGV